MIIPEPITPFTAQQAAEFENDNLGSLSILCGDVVYTDFATGTVLLRISCGNAKSAREALQAIRRAARDVLTKRAAFRLVPDTGRDLNPPGPPRVRPTALPEQASP